MELNLPAAVHEEIEQLRDFGRSTIRPLGIERDKIGSPTPPDHEFFKTVLKRGLSKDYSSEDTRGLIGTNVLRILQANENAYWDRGVASSLPGPGLGAGPVMGMGTPEQRKRYMSIFGDPDNPKWGAFAMTEPSAGSDVAAIKTRAVKDGDDWILTGQKLFSANADRADWIVTWATVDPSLGRAGHRAFMLEKGMPGFSPPIPERKMGIKAYASASFSMDQVRVPAANLLGGEEHYASRAGFKGAMKTFNATRPSIAANAVGMARACLDEALKFAEETGNIKKPRMQDRLETMRRKIRSAWLMCLRAAWLADREEENIVEASMCKATAAEVAMQVTSLGMELLGLEGVRGDHLIEKLYRDVKAMDIVEGTGQIQRVIMARTLVDLPRD
ncbi:MAG: acyl-CoA dehydrogenase family protein [Pseudomonadales bacterium]